MPIRRQSGTENKGLKQCIIYIILPVKVQEIIERGANDTGAITSVIEYVGNSTSSTSTSGDLKAATEVLSSLADARAGVNNAVVSQEEILVSAQKGCMYSLCWSEISDNSSWLFICLAWVGPSALIQRSNNRLFINISFYALIKHRL